MQWKGKYCQNNQNALNSLQLQQYIFKNLQKQCFNIWLSSFNISSFLSEKRDLFLQLKSLKMKRNFFGIWHSTYYIQSTKRIHMENGEIHFLQFKKAHIFSKWKSKWTECRYIRVLYTRRSKKLNFFIIRRNFLKWKQKTEIILEEKSQILSAMHFNRISLQLKVMHAFHTYAETKKTYKLLLSKGDELFEIRLSRVGFRKWKKHYIQRKRIKMLISSALKIWAFNLKQGKFLIWKQIIEQKKQRKNEEQEALECFSKRQLSLSILGFIFGSQKFPENLTLSSDENSNYIDPINISNNNINDNNNFPDYPKEINESNYSMILKNSSDNSEEDLLFSPMSTMKASELQPTILEHNIHNFSDKTVPYRPAFLGPPKVRP